MVTTFRPAPIALGLLVAACGGPVAPPTTGGVTVADGPFGRGHALVMSDYQSTNVALLDCEGNTLSGSFLSSAAAQPGLTAPLSGDVVLPGEPQGGPELALLDRFPAAVVTFVDVTTGRVSEQLEVGTGFRSNPQDLLLVDGDAWVSRYETNPKPGMQPFDGGGDIVIIDRGARSIVERIDLSAGVADAPNYWPRPGKMVRLGRRVFVLLAAYDATFANAGASRVVEIDTDSRAIVATHVLDGLAGCGAFAMEPPFDRDGLARPMRRLLVGCSGRFQGTSTPTLEDSGLVALDTTEGAVVELRRWSAEALAGRPVGFDLAIDEGGRALVTTMGRLGEGSSADLTDALVEVSLDSGETRVVFETPSRPFELGGVKCTTARLPVVPASGDAASVRRDCFAADGEAPALRRLVLGPEGYVATDALVVETAIGLPPRWLGRF